MKVVHLILVYCLGSLNQPRNSVVRLSDHLNMTIAVYCGCLGNKATIHNMHILFVEPACGEQDIVVTTSVW